MRLCATNAYAMRTITNNKKCIHVCLLQQKTRYNASIQLVILKTITNALRMRNECGLFAALMRAKRPISDTRSASRPVSAREEQL